MLISPTIQTNYLKVGVEIVSFQCDKLVVYPTINLMSKMKGPSLGGHGGETLHRAKKSFNKETTNDNTNSIVIIVVVSRSVYNMDVHLKLVSKKS